MTDCILDQMELQGMGRRKIVASFDGGSVTSDAGALLLREVIMGTGLIKRFSGCFKDYRDQDRIEHPLENLLSQRISGLAMGYEDLNDHDRLRTDPLFATVVGQPDILGARRENPQDRGAALAGRNTLNRLEITPADASAESRYAKIVYDGAAIERFFTDWFIERHDKPLKTVWIDLDATDDPTHGNQEGKHFHGYYDCDCFLPLYLFCGDDLLSARLRTSDCDPMEGVMEDLARVVGQIRAKWPDSRIIVRGDSGFCREELMLWCEIQKIDYVLGLAQNSRLVEMIKKDLKKSKRRFKQTGKPSKRYRNLKYQTLSTWSRKRRVVAKAEHLEKGANPRFVVTSIKKSEFGVRALYEDLYCARGEMENRIKEQQMGLFSDRTSSHTLRANQLRLWFSSVAYLLMTEVRRVGLKGTEFEKAQCWTIRERLFKIGAVVTVSVRRIVVSMASSYPWQELFHQCLRNLQQHYPLRV